MLALHIGPHKTGTTYIQHNLKYGNAALVSSGLHYPPNGRGRGAAHHDLAHHADAYLHPDGAHYDELKRLGKWQKRKSTKLVFSAEGFCRWSPDQFTALAEVLGQDRFTLIYAIRDPLDVFHSFWSEQIKQGYHESLTARFAQHFNDPMASRILNPMLDLEPLLSLPGASVKVLLYDDIRRRDTDIFEVMMRDGLGFEGAIGMQDTRANPRYPVELTEFLRILTRMRSGGSRHITSALRNKFIKNLKRDEWKAIIQTVKATHAKARRIISVPRDTLFYQELERQIRATLGENIIGEMPDAPLFPAEPLKMPYYNGDILKQDPAVRTLLDLHDARLGARLKDAS